MPSGKEHNRALKSAAPVVAIGAALATGDPVAGLLAGLGCYTGYILSPDLDQEAVRTESEWLVEVWLGKIIGWLWRLMWYPYGALIPHRNPLSHMPLLSTVLRVTYMFACFYILSLGKFYPNVNDVMFWWWFSGLCVADTIHWGMDMAPRRR